MKLLDQLYFSSTSETDKGTRFERFTQSFLQTDPLWSEQFEKIWMWDQWPDRWGPDTGIDLVAQRRDGGKTAIQCKFYDPQSRVSKADIDTFLSASGRGGFTERIIVSTTTQWGPNAETAIRDQSIPVRRIGLNDFEQSRINWDLFDPATPTVLELSGSSDLRPYQRNAIDQVTQGFTGHDRGRLIMACGTGKTFTSLRLAEEYVGPRGTVPTRPGTTGKSSATSESFPRNASTPTPSTPRPSAAKRSASGCITTTITAHTPPAPINRPPAESTPASTTS